MRLLFIALVLVHAYTCIKLVEIRHEYRRLIQDVEEMQDKLGIEKPQLEARA